MSRDPLWRELEAIERRQWAGLEARFGTCPICRMPANEVFRFGTIAWSACDGCGERWPVGELLAPLEDEIVQELHLEILAKEFRQTTEGTRSVDDMSTELITEAAMLKRNDPVPAAVDHVAAAKDALTKLEALTPGAAYREAALLAAQFIDGALTAARAVVFPDRLEPAADAVLRDFELAIKELPAERQLAGPMTDLHGASIDAYPEFAACVRSPRGRRMISARAREMSTIPMSENPAEGLARAEAKVMSRFELAVAEQLRARGLLLPHAEIIALGVPQFRERLAAAIATHEAAERKEKDRVAREQEQRIEGQRATERAAEQRRRLNRLAEEDRDGMRARRRTLVDFYERHSAYTFTIAGGAMTGAQAARELESGAEFAPFYQAQNSGAYTRQRGWQ